MRVNLLSVPGTGTPIDDEIANLVVAQILRAPIWRAVLT
jgi:hypothetical protein